MPDPNVVIESLGQCLQIVLMILLNAQCNLLKSMVQFFNNGDKTRTTPAVVPDTTTMKKNSKVSQDYRL
jgi:hypothetical protein